ncbi:stage V sporulation protein AA [Blautia sp. An249]|uniref:stage V sporulation protein AA n=1 Tax=Blautia sp. An249 TaxID=1965603 RepID=UPI000B381D4E|nr:stage V sporulation protein AA [Blautia sp. An249]OUO78812.1 stage V sporulation protein AA [Blautia sp. An249]
MSNTLYMQFDKNVEVRHPHVYLQDVAELSCTDPKVLDRCRVIKILHLDEKKPGRYVVSVNDILKLLLEKEEKLDVTATGETTFVVTYRKEQQGRMTKALKAAFVCLITFFGTAFAIMTFNNDVSVEDLFAQIYQQVTGEVSNGFTALEISYSAGIGFGVLFFFNHFGRRKITEDPTPMQVQMRLYEDNVNKTIVEDINRKQEQNKGKKG